jgi:hypothetical protein
MTLVVAGLALASCGETPGKFVGNKSCPSTAAEGATGTAPVPYDPNPPATSGDPVGQAIDEMPHTHVAPPTTIEYNHTPPTSGCHYSLSGSSPAPIAAGVYNAPIAPEYWVHNLEHGYVAILYNCPKACDADFQKVQAWFKSQGPDAAAQSCSPKIPYAKIIVLPYATMAPQFAAVSWDYYDAMPKLDLAEIQKFYDNHTGHSPEGACTG